MEIAKNVSALAFLLGFGAVTLYYSIKKKLNSGLSIAFIAFALVGSYGIARIDAIVSFKGLGVTVQTAVREVNRAKDDALRNVVEAQEAGIKQLQASLAGTQEELDRIEVEGTIFSAQNDDRHAFDMLSAWARNPDGLYFYRSQAVYNEIVGDPEGPFQKLGFVRQFSQNPMPRSLSELKQSYASVHRNYKPGAIQFFWEMTPGDKAEKLEFLKDVIVKDSSLRAALFAKRMFDQEAKVDFNFYEAEKYQKWWDENRNKL